MSACSRPPPASSRSAKCASRPMRPGGSAPRSRTTSCATGRSCAAAPRSAQKALFFNLRRLRARLAQRRGAALQRDASTREIAGALGVSEADVEMMDSRLSAPDTSLNAPLHDERRRRVRPAGFPGRRTMPLPDEIGRRARSTSSAARPGCARRSPCSTSASCSIVEERRLQRRGRHAGGARRDASASPRSASARSRTAPWKSSARAGEAEPGISRDSRLSRSMRPAVAAGLTCR